jgi:hypothetical protein
MLLWEQVNCRNQALALIENWPIRSMSVMAILCQLSWPHAQPKQDGLRNRVCLSQSYRALRPTFASPGLCGHGHRTLRGLLRWCRTVPSQNRRCSCFGETRLFSRLGQTFRGEYVGQGKWSDVYVFRDGCVPDGKCESIADGRVWVDALNTPPKHISGKYEINLNGKVLEGNFVARRHDRKHALRLCM